MDEKRRACGFYSLSFIEKYPYDGWSRSCWRKSPIYLEGKLKKSMRKGKQMKTINNCCKYDPIGYYDCNRNCCDAVFYWSCMYPETL